ncbi:YbaB/EbfC family nucleoid-associated protein [Hamadaea sp. NPDC050747]|uniref:YbaB/EbfC family nucleoid-associated protein n=1 Tax=Hamadaea sp. NPDC050747 TaxID=3155789 RepID=UPI003405C1D5
MFGDDLGAAEEAVDRWEASLQERADAARRVRERLDAVTGIGSDPDRIVQVTVAPSGVLADIKLPDQIRRQSVDLTRQQILQAAQAAQADLARKAALVVADTIGMNHPTANAIVSSYTRRLTMDPGDAAR